MSLVENVSFINIDYANLFKSQKLSFQQKERIPKKIQTQVTENEPNSSLEIDIRRHHFPV
jgi:hypothetical protein